MGSDKPGVTTVLGRGLRKRCPHCGKGNLFRRWIAMYDRCSECGLVYQRNHGDTWLFWIIGDRIPVGLGIVALYFGFRPSSAAGFALFFLAMVIPLVATMPRRQGLGVALNYLSRIYMPDPSDELPPARPAARSPR
jgi:uncharacterized protein (DUF983 family)